MSLLQMFACEGCGATVRARDTLLGTDPPLDWLQIEGPATQDEVPNYRQNRPSRHVCSPACMAVLAERLAEMDGALVPLSECVRQSTHEDADDILSQHPRSRAGRPGQMR
jgi:hypothetical protein